jgi:hypothetical protein
MLEILTSSHLCWLFAVVTLVDSQISFNSFHGVRPFFEKLIFALVGKKLSTFIGPQDSLTCLQKPAIVFSKIHYDTILFSCSFQTKILYVSHLPHVC